jgi:ABC-2 type transport system permease protein
MSDEPKGDGVAQAEAPPSAPTTQSAPAEAPRSIDWGSLVPQTAGEIVFDALKIFVFALIIMNAWAVWHGCDVTTRIMVAGTLAGLATTVAWKTFLAAAEAFGTRVVGVAYVVGGIASCAAILWYARAGESVTTSSQLKAVIQVIGVAFLYPAFLGGLAIAKGQETPEVNPLGLPLSPRWFATLWTLYAKEMWTFFTSPLPYLIAFVFLGVNGGFFHLLVNYYTRPGMGDLPKPGEILFMNLYTIFVLWFIWPGLTMRLVAEERSKGTLETLLTAPVTDSQVIFSKFGACMSYFALMLLPILGYIAFMAQYAKDWDWGPVYASFLGLFLWGGMSMSIGVFFSTLTDNQLVAFLLSAGANFMMFILSQFEQSMKEDSSLLWGAVHLKPLAHYLSIHVHYAEFLKGIVSTQSLAFFLSITALGIFGSVRGLEAQRWK